jgi:hypothetical protein
MDRRSATAVRLLVAVAALSAPACGDSRPATRDTIAVPRRDTVIIDGATPRCGSCRLEVMAPIRLGTPGDADIPQRVPQVLRDSRGTHYLVFNGWSQKPILRYDSAGRFIGRLGGSGQGPGEYTMTTRVILGLDDSVVVFLGPQGQVFNPNGEFVRTLRTPGYGVFAMAPDGGGGAYAVRTLRFETHGAHPHVIRLTADGTAQDSFPIFSAVVGKGSVRSGSREREHDVRMVGAPTLAPDGSIWTSVHGNYRLERHDPDGTPRQLIGVALPGQSPPRLRAAEVESLAAVNKRPPPSRRRPVNARPRIMPWRTATTLSVDTTGLLWVVRTIAAPRWDTITVSAQYLSPHEAPGEATIPRAVEDRFYHTIVDVIDPRRAELLGRAHLPFHGHSAAPGWIARVTTDEDGHYLTSVYQLVLRGR